MTKLSDVLSLDGLKSLSKMIFLGEIVPIEGAGFSKKDWQDNFKYNEEEKYIYIRNQTLLPERMKGVFKNLEVLPCLIKRQRNRKVLEAYLPWLKSNEEIPNHLPIFHKLVLYKFVQTKSNLDIKIIKIFDDCYNPDIHIFPVGKKQHKKDQIITPLVDSVQDYKFTTYPEIFGAPPIFYYSKQIHRNIHQMVLGLPTAALIRRTIYKNSQVIVLEFEEGAFETLSGGIKSSQRGGSPTLLVASEDQLRLEVELLKSLEHNLKSRGIYIDSKDLHYFHASVKTQNVTVVRGDDGNGKSALCQTYAKTFGAVPGDNLLTISPSYNWCRPVDFLTLDGIVGENYYQEFPNLLQFLRKAYKQPDRLYFLIIEDMNIARVENYFSQFWSMLPKGSQITRLSYIQENSQRLEHVDEVAVGANLVVLGTLSQDITAYPLSTKMVDRFSLIELSKQNFKKAEKVLGVFKFMEEKNVDVSVKTFREVWRRDVNPYSFFTHTELKIFDSINDLLNERMPNYGITYRTLYKMANIIGNGMLPNEINPYPNRGDWIDRVFKESLLQKLYGSHPVLKVILGEYTGVKWAKGELAQLLESEFAKEISCFQESLQKLHKKAKELEYEGFAY